MMIPEANRSTGDILTDAMQSLSALVRNEMDLARAEVAQSLRTTVSSLVTLLVAAVLALTALNVLAAALVTALTSAGMEPWLASILVGIGLLLVAAAIAMGAIATLKSTSIAPQRAARNVRRDAEAVKEAYNDQ